MRVHGLAILGLLAGLAAPAFAEETPKRDLTVEQATALDCCTQHPGALKIAARVDRPDATYGLGETVRLWVSANESAYLTVFDIGPSGTVTQLFPNEYQSDSHVMPGQLIEVAGPATGARITVGGPVGAELIKIVASSKPITVVSQGALHRRGQFRELEGGVRALVRDLEVVGSNAPATGEEDVRIALKNLPIYTVAAGEAMLPGTPPVPVVAPGEPVPGVPVVPPAPDVPGAPISGAPGTMMLPVVTPQAAPAALLTLPPQQPFPLLLAVDKPSYHVGESVLVAVTALAPCYLTLFDATTSGTVRLLFPNQLMQDNRVDGFQTVLIGRGPAAFVAIPPAGVEQIIAVCSTSPAPLLGQPLDYSQLFPRAGDRAAVSRDLAVVANNPAGAAVATASFTILP